MNSTMPFPALARRTSLTLGVVILASWGLLVAWQRSPYAELLGHESLGDHHIAFPIKISAFFLTWFLMTIAMMLPASAPALIQSVRSARQPAREVRFLAWMILGYVLPWVLVGVLSFMGDVILHELAETSGPLGGYAKWIAPTMMLATGVYQFTSLKQRCSQYCQPSHSQHQQHIETSTTAFRQGVRMGIYCVGSCGLFMLLVFSLGYHEPGWMLLLAIIFAAERLTPWGRRLSWGIGSALVISALFALIVG